MGRRILIGVVIADSHVDFQEEILRGIIAQAFKSNADIAVISPFHNFFHNSPHRLTEMNIFDLLLSDKFDGYLYERNTFFNDDVKSHIDKILQSTGKPVMLLDSGEHKSFETASIDDSEAFEALTDHLIDVHGKKRIYCLTGPKKLFVSEERLKGYKNSMKKHGLYSDKSFWFYGDFWKSAARQLAERIISGDIPRPDAVVCGNDVMAAVLEEALIAGGINVPEDIAVTGYDASVDGYNATPSITSYRRPNFQLGAEAFRRLYRIVTGKICNRIPNAVGQLRLGQSCGCCEDHSLKHKIERRSKINSSLESGMLYGDMLFDITNTDNTDDFAERLDNYTYIIYKMRHLDICLTKQYVDSPTGSFDMKLGFSPGDSVKTVLSKSSIRREETSGEYFSSHDLLPVFSDDHRRYPVAYYLSPLHYNENFFGYSAISFGKEPMSFGSLYLKWINYVNVALEQLRIRAMMKRTISDTSRALLWDELTGLRNRSGLEHELSHRIASASEQELTADCIRFKLSGISKAYYQDGEDKCRRILRSFAHVLSDCLGTDDICGVWSTNTLCVLSFEPGRADALYSRLIERIREPGLPDEESCNIDFTVGQYNLSLADGANLGDAMHKAAVNRLFSYSLSGHSTNPQFEKLCLLRNNIMKEPEKPWSISEIADSLYLSKSYLQKIYKSYFGKSIIEEMIHFRIEKAKAMLTQTKLTVTEIARECGYSSYNYFVRQFKASEGKSPSDYRAAGEQQDTN